MTKIATVVWVLSLALSFNGMSQEEQKENEVHVVTVKVEDGNKIVTDTTFTMKEGEDPEEILNNLNFSSEDDSMEITTDVRVVTKNDLRKGKKRTIIIESDGENEKIEELEVPCRPGHPGVMKFKTDKGEKVIIMDAGRFGDDHYVWKSDGGEDYDFDFEFDEEQFNKELKESNIIFLEDMEDLEDLQDMDIEIVRPPRHPRNPGYRNPEFEWHRGVTEKELRDAGIRNKPDRLEIEDLDVDINDGIVNLKFSIKDDISPRVDVYNYFGVQVFSGKPEMVNEKFQLTMDLSKKQHGRYYLQIVYKNSSFTDKFRL